ncbi:endonuclease V [Longimycelium tulufanense]|uniref:Endonuclease V n=1 Tax=Longimycelium tulufanense TaxID=907463 RepID=A0A8J3FW27_9PSEU|nr:endonuclease V [Longimycelium tulufanense]GGM73513.1 endonuclease V [Longimycelium tulufanense]
MRLHHLHEWPMTVDEAEAVQERLRGLVKVGGTIPRPRTVAGLDVAYEEDSGRLAAAISVLDAETLDQVDESILTGSTDFPYVTGLFAFRELPSLIRALQELRTRPDLLVVDGHGLAHPRRFGLACHVGVLTDLPCIGVAKTSLGRYEPPGPARGDWTPLRIGEDVVGRALRTQDEVKPVFVSVGHKLDLEVAARLTLWLSPRYRLPETTRHADHLARAALAG